MSDIQLRLKHGFRSTIQTWQAITYKRILQWSLLSVLLLICLGSGIMYGYISSLVKDVPIPSKSDVMAALDNHTLTGYAYFNNQTEIGRLWTGEDRLPTELTEIPQHVIDAFIAIEDTSFYSHSGVDWLATLRAIRQQIGNEDVQTGGSTITQQLTRRLFLNLDQTYQRKAAEIFLAWRMERVASKDDILLAYLNDIYFGRGSSGSNLYGIKAAAKGIFGVDQLYELHLAQAAYLAGLPQQPNAYSAYSSDGQINPEALASAIKRQRLVLQRMQQEELISASVYEGALQFDLAGSLAPTRAKEEGDYPFLMGEVERRATELLMQLEHPDADKLDPNYETLWQQARSNLVSNGYKVHTTINPTIYKAMKKIAQDPANFTENHPEKGMEQIGAMMIHNQTGAILGMIEGRDFAVEQLNHATQMVRQPGSAMKPIAAYLPAMEQGMIQPASIIDDVPLVMDNGGSVHIPDNWDGKYHGLVTAREALKRSYNIPALKLFNETVGIEEAWRFARRLGITTIVDQDQHARTGVLGGLTRGVTVEELTNAYAAIGNEGRFNDAYLIESIVDAKGVIVYQHTQEPAAVFSEETAYLMTDMMRDVVRSGTGSDMNRLFGHSDQVPFAGKTGTTQNHADVWFIGYTPDVTVGVWAGYEQSVHSLSRSDCSKTAGCGTQRAKRIWAQVMDASIEQQPDLFETTAFTMPPTIVKKTVSSYTGLLPTELLLERGDVVTDLFHPQYVPTEVDDRAGMTSYTIFGGVTYLAQPETPDDMISQSFKVRREKPIQAIMQEVEAGLARIPLGQRKPLSHYYPVDAELDGPSEIDPRTDDGHAPSPPERVKYSGREQANLSFALNGEPDVVGYRLYGSNDGNNYAYIAGKPVSTEAEAQFNIGADQPDYYMFVVTAVDVAGRESDASAIVFNESKSIDRWFSDYFNNKKPNKNKNKKK